MTAVLEPLAVPSPVPDRRLDKAAVPWSTVIPLAIVLAYADGFWMISLRGAVGAIERAQHPFETWARESTLTLPIFAIAVLGALTIALRRWGPDLRGSRPALATAGLVAVAGTVAGAGLLAASSAYDYHLQISQVARMGSMGTMCSADCIGAALQSTGSLQVRAVGYGSAMLLVTNVVLVAWVLALRGGRLAVGRPAGARLGAIGGQTRSTQGVRLLALALVASAAVHAAVVPEHLDEWLAAGIFFILLTAAQLAIAGLVLLRPGRLSLGATVLVSVGPLCLWLVSRTSGMPFGPESGVPEPVGLADCVACALEIGAVVLACVLLRAGSRDLRPGLSSHAITLCWLTVVAVTALGLAGTTLPGLDSLPPGASMSAAP